MTLESSSKYVDEYVCTNCGVRIDNLVDGICPRCHSRDVSLLPKALYMGFPLSLETPERDETDVTCGTCGTEYIFGDNVCCPQCSATHSVTKKVKKYDSGLPMVSQMKKDFPKALLAVSDVTRYGIEKYQQPGSWREVPNCLERYDDALGRHDCKGHYEARDKESGRYHMVHRAWNALATLQIFLEEEEERTGKDVLELLREGGTFYEDNKL